LNSSRELCKKNRSGPKSSSALGNSNGQLLSESRLSVLLRNGVFGGRISLLTPRDLLRKEKPLQDQLQIMGKL
jgi:hypothetical protein